MSEFAARLKFAIYIRVTDTRVCEFGHPFTVRPSPSRACKEEDRRHPEITARVRSRHTARVLNEFTSRVRSRITARVLNEFTARVRSRHTARVLNEFTARVRSRITARVQRTCPV